MFYLQNVFSVIFCSNTLLAIPENNQIIIFMGLQESIEIGSKVCAYIKEVAVDNTNNWNILSLFTKSNTKEETYEIFERIDCTDKALFRNAFRGLLEAGNESDLKFIESFRTCNIMLKATIPLNIHKTYTITYMFSKNNLESITYMTSTNLKFTNKTGLIWLNWASSNNCNENNFCESKTFEEIFKKHSVSWFNFQSVLFKSDIDYNKYENSNLPVCTIS